jgi:hypothetical protein
MGRVPLLRHRALKDAGGFNSANIAAADIYDLRSANHRARPGAAYRQPLCRRALQRGWNQANAHNVFDYLLADRNPSQLELEARPQRAPQTHRRRICPRARTFGDLGGGPSGRPVELAASVVIPVNQAPGVHRPRDSKRAGPDRPRRRSDHRGVNGGASDDRPSPKSGVSCPAVIVIDPDAPAVHLHCGGCQQSGPVPEYRNLRGAWKILRAARFRRSAQARCH